MTLGVINGNPAMRLYKRFGFEVNKTDCCDEAIMMCLVTCLFGRPYGLCHPNWGGSDMTKRLDEAPAAQAVER